MTTHYVDIRLKTAGIAAPWEALTQEPIPLKDAKGLLEHIGPKWEARIRQVAQADDVATMLERLSALVEVPAKMIIEAHGTSGGGNAHELWFKQHEDEILNALRSGVFGAFERYRGELGLERWRPTNNVPKHRKICKRPRVTAEMTEGYSTVGECEKSWAILTEIDARAQHINAVTLPGLGITAAFVVHKARIHTATCKTCGAVSHATSIAAEVIWREHHLRREYEI
jgi:hypothetical protein